MYLRSNFDTRYPVIPIAAEGSRRESCKVTSTGTRNNRAIRVKWQGVCVRRRLV